MKAQTSILIAFTLINSTACKNSQEKQDKSVEANQTVSAAEKLTGKWIQPIPGQETEKQGVQLNSDGTASSINMHTLIYDKWELKGDTLLLWNHTAGVKATGSYIDTTIIKNITDSTLVLTSRAGLKLSYTRDK